MQQSLNHYPGEHALDLAFLKSEVEALAISHDTPDFNVRIEYDLEDEAYGFFAVAGVYPSEDMIAEGVRLVTFEYQRHDPNVKVYDAALRDAMDERKREFQAFDILYTHDGITSEASKSNIFFIKDNCLFTSPDEAVLMGITRMKTLEAAQELGIEVVKRLIPVVEIGEFEGAFLTGTSLHLLPIRQIDEYEYTVPHPLWQAVSEQFEKKIVDELDRLDL